jgi:hypothetical protein
VITPSAHLSSLQARRLAIYIALNYPAHRFLASTPHQQLLLDTFLRGELSIDQVLVHLEAHEYERERQPIIGQA